MIAAPKDDPDFATHPCHGELAQHQFLRSVLPYVKQRRMAVDVGAHIGLWTRMLAQKFSHVTAFEPVAENFACLLLNAGYKNATLENAALGALHETCAMAQRGDNSGCWAVDAGGVGVELNTLDSYKLNDVDLIKIDVEGYEGEVIAGATATLMRCRPTVVFEVNGLGMATYGNEWLDPKPILTRMNYLLAAKYQKNEVCVAC